MSSGTAPTDLSNSDKIRVVIRCRPRKETESKEAAVSCCENGQVFLQTGPGRPKRKYDFDFVASDSCTQQTIFEQAGKPVVDCTLAGFHGTIFAYGQTGSGKTHTMTGPVGAKRTDEVDHRGVVPRACEAIFSHIAESASDDIKFKVRASYLEIYNERIRDLLVDPKQQQQKDSARGGKGIYLRETASGEVLVEGGRSWVEVNSEESCIEVLASGSTNRSVGATAMNAESSRSHAIFTIEMTRTTISTMKERISQLHLVDLAGSERQKSTQAQGERLKEANEINKSLTSLGNVIKALVDSSQRKAGHRHIPYRDSKLTFLLKDALGGNSKTCLVATISPAEASLSETASTLEFAKRCSSIQTVATINEMLTSDVKELQAEVRRLRAVVKKLEASPALSKQISAAEDPHTRGAGDESAAQALRDLRTAIEDEAKRADDAIRQAQEETQRANKENARAEEEMSRAQAEAARADAASERAEAQTERAEEESKRAERLQMIVADALSREEGVKSKLRSAELRIEGFVDLVDRQEKTMEALRSVISLRDSALKEVRDGEWTRDSGIRRLRREIELIKVQRDNHPEIARLSMELSESKASLRACSAFSAVSHTETQRSLEEQLEILTQELEISLVENGALREMATPEARSKSRARSSSRARSNARSRSRGPPRSVGFDRAALLTVIDTSPTKEIVSLGSKVCVFPSTVQTSRPLAFQTAASNPVFSRQDSIHRNNKLNDLLSTLRDSVHNLEQSISSATSTPRSMHDRLEKPLA